MVSRRDVEDLGEGRLRDVAEPESSEDIDELEGAPEHDEEEEDDSADELVATLDSDDESEQASLEELLAQRAASRRVDDDSDDDSDILSFPSQAASAVPERAPVTLGPVKDRQEFVCKSCHLVKPRVQLADERRGLCRDCN